MKSKYLCGPERVRPESLLSLSSCVYFVHLVGCCCYCLGFETGLCYIIQPAVPHLVQALSSWWWLVHLYPSEGAKTDEWRSVQIFLLESRIKQGKVYIMNFIWIVFDTIYEVKEGNKEIVVFPEGTGHRLPVVQKDKGSWRLIRKEMAKEPGHFRPLNSYVAVCLDGWLRVCAPA